MPAEIDNASETMPAEARRRAAYPPTTWRTVTRLQSIKCVRLLWLMHYEAIKNGNYSTVLSAARVRARAHSREPDHIPCRTSTNAAARCIARSTTLVDMSTTRAPLQNASQTRYTRDVQSRHSVRFARYILCAVPNTPLMFITYSSWENLLHFKKWYVC